MSIIIERRPFGNLTDGDDDTSRRGRRFAVIRGRFNGELWRRMERDKPMDWRRLWVRGSRVDASRSGHDKPMRPMERARQLASDGRLRQAVGRI